MRIKRTVLLLTYTNFLLKFITIFIEVYIVFIILTVVKLYALNNKTAKYIMQNLFVRCEEKNQSNNGRKI